MDKIVKTIYHNHHLIIPTHPKKAHIACAHLLVLCMWVNPQNQFNYRFLCLVLYQPHQKIGKFQAQTFLQTSLD